MKLEKYFSIVLIAVSSILYADNENYDNASVSEVFGSTPKSVDFNERRRIGQGPSIDNFQSFYSRRLGVVLASSCGGSLL